MFCLRDSHNLFLRPGLHDLCARWPVGKPQTSAECEHPASCHYNPGVLLPVHFQSQSLRWQSPRLHTHSSSQYLGGRVGDPEVVLQRGEALGAPGKGPVDPSSWQSVWTAAEVGAGDVWIEDGEGGKDEWGGTLVLRNRGKSGGSSCCVRAGFLLQEEPLQSRNSCDPDCLSWTCKKGGIKRWKF